MKFLHLFNKSSTHDGFARIQGYDDIKDIVRRALESDENYNLLFVGPPSSSKTLFLQGILEMKSSVYFERHQPQHPRLAAHALARMNSDYQQHMQRAARPI